MILSSNSNLIRNLLLVLSFFICSQLCLAQTKKPEKLSPVKFELLSIHVMDSDERNRKAADNLDPDLCVRFRLSKVGTGTVLFYTDFPNMLSPYGHSVRKTDQGVVWLVDANGETSLKSPGLVRHYGIWMELSEGEAIEWEQLEISGRTEETHARTLFLKIGKDGSVTEVLSEFYKVPIVDSWQSRMRSTTSSGHL